MAIVLLDTPIDQSSLDFKRFSAYLDDYGVIFYRGESEQEETVPLRPTRTDVGNNPWEVRPESGDIFSQGEFTSGSGQIYFHREGGDSKAFLYSEGVDFSDGRVRGLLDQAVFSASSGVGGAVSAAGGGRTVQVGGYLFVVALTTEVRRFDSSLTAADYNPHDGEGTTNIYDITTDGESLYVALGANGVHKGTTAGSFTHFQPDGAVDLDTGDTRLVRWIRNRLWVVGAGGRKIYEVTADSTPAEMETLAAGWQFTDILENDQYIYATAWNPNSGESAIHRYGINSAGTAVEPKGKTNMPLHHPAHVGIGVLGRVLIGGGSVTDQGGYDPVLWQAIPGEGGELTLVKIAEGKGSTTNDQSVKAMLSTGEEVLVGWSLTSGSPYGERMGLARYDLANDAFFHHNAETSGASRVAGITVFGGRLIWIYHQGGARRVNQAGVLVGYRNNVYLVTSIADWNNMGLKTYRAIDILHKPLPAHRRFAIYYTTSHPEEDDWVLGGYSDVASSTGKSFQLTDVSSRTFALKIVMGDDGTGDTTETPELIGFSVRSDPLPETAEWKLTRFIRIRESDRNEPSAQPILRDVRASVDYIRELAYEWVTFAEPGVTWNVRVESVARIEPTQPAYSVTGGEKRKERNVMRVVMQGTKS